MAIDDTPVGQSSAHSVPMHQLKIGANDARGESSAGQAGGGNGARSGRAGRVLRLGAADVERLVAFVARPARETVWGMPAAADSRLETTVLLEPNGPRGAARELQRLSAELGEQYEVVKSQRDTLLRLQLQKEQLTAFVVHDLKNPVNTLDLHAQFLQRNASLPPEVLASIAAIRREARQLSRMISNLLDISKASAERLAPRLADLDLRALVGEVLAEFTLTAQQRNVGLRSLIATNRLRADGDLLRRVLTNLVENALRFSPSGGEVLVTAGSVAGATELRVTDAGPGIAPALRSQVFDAFVQVEPGASIGHNPAGRGLGLAFCKVAVEAHRGHIWVEDAAPGAVFCVSLPLGG
jgi:two-component system, sensor histidine kinase and response regulator